MKTGTKVILGVVILLVVFFILNFFGVFERLNPITNLLIAGAPDKNCSTDNDCVIKQNTCIPNPDNYCGDAVNKEWERFCPFNEGKHGFIGMLCPPRNTEAKCINNICQKVSLETYCQSDAECACGVHAITGDCFYGNQNYVDSSKQCPDFCTGIAGNFEIKCVENKCTQVQIKQF